MFHNCKRCLLFEAGDSVTYNEIMAYVATIDKSELVDDEILNCRLNQCKKCDYLISGMCRKCGCYVEVRARIKKQFCPNYDNKKW